MNSFWITYIGSKRKKIQKKLPEVYFIINISRQPLFFQANVSIMASTEKLNIYLELLETLFKTLTLKNNLILAHPFLIIIWLIQVTCKPNSD